MYRNDNPDKKEQLILSGKKGWKIKDIINKKYSSQYREDIILLGYIDRLDMPALYSGARVFAYPSFYEGFGLPVLEAMACGTPIITSDRSSLPEVAGPHARYFDPTDIPDMSMAIAEMSGGISADQRVAQIAYAQSFTWEKMADRVMKALEHLS